MIPLDSLEGVAHGVLASGAWLAGAGVDALDAVFAEELLFALAELVVVGEDDGAGWAVLIAKDESYDPVDDAPYSQVFHIACGSEYTFLCALSVAYGDDDAVTDCGAVADSSLL